MKEMKQKYRTTQQIFEDMQMFEIGKFNDKWISKKEHQKILRRAKEEAVMFGYDYAMREMKKITKKVRK